MDLHLSIHQDEDPAKTTITVHNPANPEEDCTIPVCPVLHQYLDDVVMHLMQDITVVALSGIETAEARNIEAWARIKAQQN